MLLAQVLDLTELIQHNRGPLAEPLIAAAGTDVSHWFTPRGPPRGSTGDTKTSRSGGVGRAAVDARDMGTGRPPSEVITGEPRTYIDPQTGLRVPYLPMGR